VVERLCCTLSTEPDRRTVLWIRGEVDLATAEQFRRAALSSMRRGERVVFDVEGAMFLDASGLRVLNTLSREARRLDHPAPVLRGMRPLLARSLKTAGLLDSFAREPATPFTLVREPRAGRRTVAPAPQARTRTATVGGAG
jgi:anti-anti-sigma factor